MLKNILLVGLGGFAGSIARYLTYLLIEKRIGALFPWGTFTVNIIGSLLLGVIAGLLLKNNLTETSRLLLAVGFCGSFTTFSTFALENLQLLGQKPLISVVYILASVLVGLIMVFAGYFLGRSI